MGSIMMIPLEILTASENDESDFIYVFKISGKIRGRGWNFRKIKTDPEGKYHRWYFEDHFRFF
jgi:hypothetical protein